MQYYIGVDVGTGSARAGIFNQDGQLLGFRSKEIQIHSPFPDHYEQSSSNIWASIVEVVRGVMDPFDPSLVTGLSFCATCSLVSIGPSGQPVPISVSPSDSSPPCWDIIMWMDHRASKEAEFINSKPHTVLDYVGGKISLEMQTPKLLWIKKHLPQSYANTQHFFDLPDFLKWKATRSLKRSMCSIVCKWTHVNSPEGNHWDHSFFHEVGLEDVLEKIGESFSHPGEAERICPKAAEELGLHPNVLVGTSLIDAHAGVLGMLGCSTGIPRGAVDVTRRLGIICGTSNCHMAISREPCSVGGVWGPYYGVIYPNLYLNEGGQSAAGKLLDHVVSTHPAYGKLIQELNSHGKVLSRLEAILMEAGGCYTEKTKDVHIWPDFHGNRSPLADPTLRGMMTGLTLSDSENDLSVLYLATIQALAYGSLHIVNEMKRKGHSFEFLVICGGLTKSQIFLQSHADILQLPVIVPNCQEPVLLGAAIAAASGVQGDIATVLKRMSGEGKVVEINETTFSYHKKKFAVFQEMLNDQLKYRKLME